MCLDMVTERSTEKRGKGWKVFGRTSGSQEQFYSPIMEVNSTYLRGEWYEAKVQKLTGHTYDAYVTGFHIFTGWRGWFAAHRYWKMFYNAPTFVVKRVEYSDGHTIGKQNGYQGTVAFKMRIL